MDYHLPTSLDVPLQDQRIDDLAAIVHDQIFLDLDLHRLGIDFEDHGVDATCSGASFWTEIIGIMMGPTISNVLLNNWFVK
jgi:hypothetical protein